MQSGARGRYVDIPGYRYVDIPGYCMEPLNYYVILTPTIVTVMSMDLK